MRHHQQLHEVPPWRRREVARNTGQKCERSEFSPTYRQARRLDRKRIERASLKMELSQS